MANRCATTTTIETLSGNVAASIFDGNWNNPVTALNEASLGYVNGIATDSGSANNYIVTPVIGTVTAYNPGMVVAFLPANTNTGNSTLTVSPLVAASIFDFAGNPVAPGAIQANILTFCVYISGAFRLLYTQVPGILVTNQVNSNAGTTTLTINCGGYGKISMSVDSSLGPNNNVTVLNVTNVMKGADFSIVWKPGANTQTLKFSATCTDQAGTTIAHITQWGNNAEIDLIASGQTAVPNAMLFLGTYIAFPSPSTGVSGIRFAAQFYH